MCVPKTSHKRSEIPLEQRVIATVPNNPNTPQDIRLHSSQNVPHLSFLCVPAEPNEYSSSHLLTWTLPINISQSRLGERKTPSNACTIITLAMVDLFHRFDTALPYKDANDNWTLSKPRKESHSSEEYMARETIVSLPEDMLRILTNGIISGNIAHSKAMIKRKEDRTKGSVFPKELFSEELRDTFTVPQAIEAIEEYANTKIHEIDFISVQGNLTELPALIQIACSNSHLSRLPNIFLILIVVERAVLIVYQRETQTIALFDSHSHHKGLQGSMIACANIKRIRNFVQWIVKHIYPELENRSGCIAYELSCVHVTGPRHTFDNPMTIFQEKILDRVFRKKGPRKLVNTKISESKSKDSKTPSKSLDRSDSGTESDSDSDSEDSDSDSEDSDSDNESDSDSDSGMDSDSEEESIAEVNSYDNVAEPLFPSGLVMGTRKEFIPPPPSNQYSSSIYSTLYPYFTPSYNVPHQAIRPIHRPTSTVPVVIPSRVQWSEVQLHSTPTTTVFQRTIAPVPTPSLIAPIASNPMVQKMVVSVPVPVPLPLAPVTNSSIAHRPIVPVVSRSSSMVAAKEESSDFFVNVDLVESYFQIKQELDEKQYIDTTQETPSIPKPLHPLPVKPFILPSHGKSDM